MAILEERRTGFFSALSHEAARVAEKVRAGVVVVRGQGGGHGSGVIWQENGLIVTNDHVVGDGGMEVLLADGRRMPANVLKRDPERDLATLRVSAIGLPAVPVGDSRKLRAGELIMAVGNPLGVERAVSVGIVSRTPGEVRVGRRRIPEMVQADVDLYPGNSGGPLVNARGEVVGINSMVTGPGMALAVPSHVAEDFLAESSKRAYLGVTLRSVELPRAIAQPLGIGVDQGLMVFDLTQNGPAEQAGLLPGDLLIALDGHVLEGSQDLTRNLVRLGPRRPARLTVLRAGKLVDMTAIPREEAA